MPMGPCAELTLIEKFPLLDDRGIWRTAGHKCDEFRRCVVLSGVGIEALLIAHI